MVSGLMSSIVMPAAWSATPSSFARLVKIGARSGGRVNAVGLIPPFAAVRIIGQYTKL